MIVSQPTDAAMTWAGMLIVTTLPVTVVTGGAPSATRHDVVAVNGPSELGETITLVVAGEIPDGLRSTDVGDVVSGSTPPDGGAVGAGVPSAVTLMTTGTVAV